MKDYEDDSFPGMATIFAVIVFICIIYCNKNSDNKDLGTSPNPAPSQAQPAPSASK